MATWYVDYVNGNNANAGTSWGAAFQTINGATAAKGVVAGDSGRVAKSPDPTALGQNATWTDSIQSKQSASWLVNGATNASPIVAQTSSNHNLVNGDCVYITGVSGNTAANGLWQVTVVDATHIQLNGSTGNGTYSGSGTLYYWTSHAVQLTTAVTAVVDNCDVAWSVANSATSTADSAGVAKCGYYSTKVVVPATAANTLYAYKALPSAQDYSGYQQITFWVKNTVAIADNARFRVCLCSDAAGTTIVNSAAIPAIPSTGQWYPVTVDLGTSLGNSIQSVALYSGASTMATNTLNLDNILVAKSSSSPDSVTLQSLISKNTGTEGWWPIQCIIGKNIFLDIGTSPTISATKGYSGTTETVPLYKRETIKTNVVSSNNTAAQQFSVNGTISSPISFSGGWNTSTNTQDGDTYFDGLVGWGAGLQCQSATWINVSKINFTRYNYGFYVTNTSNFLTYNFHSIIGCFYGVYFTLGHNCSVTGTHLATNGYNIYTSSSDNNTFKVTNCVSCSGTYSVYISGINNKFYIDNLKNNATNINNSTGSYTYVYNTNMANSVTDLFNAAPLYLKNSYMSSATDYSTGNYVTHKLYSHNHNNVAGSHRIYGDGMRIVTDTTTVHTAGGTSWKLSPTGANRSANNPVDLPIDKVFCPANQSRTFTAWFRRDNTGITGQLVIKGGLVNGISNDVTDTMTASANTWEQRSITVTPTEDCVIEVLAYAYGGTTYNVWVTETGVS